MTHDRNYLTMLSDAELVRIALDRNHELAVVLAERLSELLTVEDELVELQILYDRLVAENNALRDDVAQSILILENDQ